MKFRIDAACGSDIGLYRMENEDNFCFAGKIRFPDDGGKTGVLHGVFENGSESFAVFDGLGGESDGQLAAYIAAKTFQFELENTNKESGISEEMFRNTVTVMNDMVVSGAEQKHNHMGTTVVSVGFSDGNMILCNVGDSRAYRLRNNTFEQISKDHVEEIPPFMRARKNVKPRLSQCLGMPQEELLIDPYITSQPVLADDIFLLCSDGITDMLSADEIKACLCCCDPEKSVSNLIGSALKKGGKDNATALVIIIKNKETEEKDHE